MSQRALKYSQAISEAMVQALESDERVFLFGIGADDPKGIFGTTTEAAKRFGPPRVFDTPASENALTGLAIGAALSGLKPVLIHARNDFLYYSMDQLANHAAKWYHMFGGLMKIPVVIRAIVGKGWGQGAQHSQSLQALFAHLPGLKVAMPSTPYDAKGIFLGALADPSPVIIIEHRRLHDGTGPVPREMYTLAPGKGEIARKGKDATIVAVSLMVPEAVAAAEILKTRGIDVEIVDPRWVKPLDKNLILRSVRKTGRLVVLDTSWKMCGISAEIAALAAEEAFDALKAPVVRVALPDLPAPTTAALERVFYPGADEIVAAVERTLGRKRKTRAGGGSKPQEAYIGPF